MDALAQRVLPILQEYGLSAFVLIGYLEDAENRLQRVCIANTGKNPAFEDGLRPAIQFAHMWGATPGQFRAPAPPPDGTPEDGR